MNAFSAEKNVTFYDAVKIIHDYIKTHFHILLNSWVVRVRNNKSQQILR